ncbi:MAG: HAMP domain-containing sensor histidine kinase [Mycobacterium sp.]
MGLRVRATLVILLLLAVAALAVPLAQSLAQRRTAALAAERERQLSALAVAAANVDPPVLQQLIDRYYAVYGEGVVAVDADGRTLAERGLTAGDPGVAHAAGHAEVNATPPPWARIWPWERRHVLAATGVRRDGELVGAVVTAVDTSAAARAIAVGWLWVAAGCLALLALAVLVARGLTRWVLRPVDGLERAVAAMTEGVSGPPADVTGPPELRHFTTAFNTMAHVVRSSLERQRRLVADASHQLRNPLAAVRLRADTLEDTVTEAGQPTYRSMTAELDRLENLLGQLLRLARAEEASGSRRVGLTVPDDPTVLTDVITERLRFWQPVAEDNRQLLRDRSVQPGPVVRVSRHDIEQLVDVAVDNALRYAGPDTTITVAATRTDRSAELAISDNGPGLPEADLDKAAARFWRGRTDIAGTGLGLAIAAEITAGHDGTITLEVAPEGGLLVRYRLPVADGNAR